MGRLRPLVVAGLIVALAALLLRASCGDAEEAPSATREAPRAGTDATSRDRSETPRAAADVPPQPRPRARAHPATLPQGTSPDESPVAPDDDPAPTPRATELLVIVIGEDRARAAGAVVRWGADYTPQGKWRESMTNASGELRIALTDERVRITASRDGLLGVSATTLSESSSGGDAPAMSIVLERPVTIRGVVTDPAGHAVEGAFVSTRLSWIRPVETAADGTFEFPPVPRSSFPQSLLVIADGYVNAEPATAASAAGAEPVRVALSWELSVRMRLLDEAGALVTDAVIQREGWFREWKSADGRLVLLDVQSPGECLLSARDSLGARVEWTGAGPEIDLGDVSLATLKPTPLQFVWPDGAVANDVRFTVARGANPPPQDAFDAATGTAVLRLGSGTFRLVARASRIVAADVAAAAGLPPGTRDVAETALEVRAGDERRVTLVPVPLLVVRATDDEGAPVQLPTDVVANVGGVRMARMAVSGDRLALPLAGEFPMTIRFEIPGHAPAVVQLDAAPAERIHRDVVFVRAKR